MVETDRSGGASVPVTMIEERPASSSGSSSSSAASEQGGMFDTPQDMDAAASEFSVDKTWGQYSSRTAHWLRSATSRYFSVSRRVSRLYRVSAAVVASLCLLLLFRNMHAHQPGSHLSSSSSPAPPSLLGTAASPGDDGIAAAGFEARGHHIPPQIWQVMFTPRRAETGGYDFEDSLLPYTASWLAKNPDYRYTVIGTEGANRFVRRHFADEPRVLKTHFGLRNHGPRSDLMRYLIMLAKGGVYSDTDVTCLRPVDTWIPEEWRRDVKAVVGIEGDSLGGDVVGGMIWDVQFGQWTVAAVPGHRLFRRMLDQMLDRLDDLVELKRTTIDQLEMTALEIMNTTAPAGWSECVFAELQKIDPSLKEPKDLSGMKEPRLYGDIMVLPIDGFGMGVPHSGSTHDGTIPKVALVQHHFHGSWRTTDGIEQ